MYQLRGKKILPILLPSMVEAENFSDYLRTALSTTLSSRSESSPHAAAALSEENSSRHLLNLRLQGIQCLSTYLGKEFFFCLCRKSNHDSSVVLPVGTVPTKLPVLITVLDRIKVLGYI